ncbi:DUF6328 family protein [Cognatilysobacter lacus]|uniref:Uncharacterized protein n=1 Tax=Cognatilysobacter lacus TaxID=1643323 RepID=A0A5D8Z6T5_9GAMM|nr:DUF6328 family protein [Lysobacter lacus]TZF89783.1 hypothetical protein FW784_07880 [Lysobacter lacus]
MNTDLHPDDVETLSLAKSADYLLEECRVVIPGVQTLFGFQLAVAFTDRFDNALTHSEKLLHFGALALVGGAIALIMAPAAYHRLTSADRVTSHFLRVSTRMLLAGMPLLMLSLAMDTYLVGRIITGTRVAGWVAGVMLATFAGLWFALPLVSRVLRLDPSARR